MDIGCPNTVEEALGREDGKLWQAACEDELAAMRNMGIWEMTPLPAGRKAIGSRWVFKVKHNPDVSVERYRARVVAQGYSQKPEVDYKETFAPVARNDSLRTTLALSAALGYHVDCLDISTAFLYGDLDEDIYM